MSGFDIFLSSVLLTFLLFFIFFRFLSPLSVDDKLSCYTGFSIQDYLNIIRQISPSERAEIKEFLTDILPDNIKITINKGGEEN